MLGTRAPRSARFNQLLISGLLILFLSIAAGCGSARPTKPPENLTCSLSQYKVDDMFSGWHVYRARLPRPPGRADAPPSARMESFNVLSLSAGGEFGAYGAGFLVGWRSAGETAFPASRDNIQVVTGVSTGAILATHVFLGLDQEIMELYRHIGGRQIYRERNLWEYLWSDSLMESAGKNTLIADNITSELIDKVAAEHNRGRSLYIGILDFDSGEFVRIDMVKLANELKPKEDRDRCYRAVIGASSAIPIIFSPVFIDNSMWVDGGSRKHLFVTEPPAAAMEPGVARRLFSFVHGDLSVEKIEVRNRVLSIAGRTAEVFTDQGLKDSVRLQDALASRCPEGYNCRQTGKLFQTFYAGAAAAAVSCSNELSKCETFSGVAQEDMFCSPFMNCLADAGEKDGRDYALKIRDWLTIEDLQLGPKAPDRALQRRWLR